VETSAIAYYAIEQVQVCDFLQSKNIFYYFHSQFLLISSKIFSTSKIHKISLSVSFNFSPRQQLKNKMKFSITELLIFSAVTFLSAILWQNRRFLYLAKKIPTIKFSVIKNFRWKIDNRGVFKLIYDHIWQVKDLGKAWLGTQLFVVVASPEYAKVVMNKCLEKPWMVDFLKLEKSVLFGSGELWHTHRKIMSPFFGVNTVKNLIPMFEKNVKTLLDNVSEKCEKGEFDVFNFMAALTLETVLKAMELDTDLQNQSHEVRDVAIENLEM
jgi:hypothetical protein